MAKDEDQTCSKLVNDSGIQVGQELEIEKMQEADVGANTNTNVIG